MCTLGELDEHGLHEREREGGEKRASFICMYVCKHVYISCIAKSAAGMGALWCPQGVHSLDDGDVLLFPSNNQS